MTPVERTKSFIVVSQPVRGTRRKDVRAFSIIAGITIIYAFTFSRDCYLLMLTAAFCSLPVII